MTSAGSSSSPHFPLLLGPHAFADSLVPPCVSLCVAPGTGIRHSEYNRNTSKQVHFLQIWALPNKSRLPPTYYTRHVTDAEKREGLVRVVGPVGTEGVSEDRDTKGPAPVRTHTSRPSPRRFPPTSSHSLSYVLFIWIVCSCRSTQTSISSRPSSPLNTPSSTPSSPRSPPSLKQHETPTSTSFRRAGST